MYKHFGPLNITIMKTLDQQHNLNDLLLQIPRIMQLQHDRVPGHSTRIVHCMLNWNERNHLVATVLLSQHIICYIIISKLFLLVQVTHELRIAKKNVAGDVIVNNKKFYRLIEARFINLIGTYCIIRFSNFLFYYLLISFVIFKITFCLIISIIY